MVKRRNTLLQIRREEGRLDVVAAEAPRGLGEVVGAKAEELRRFRDLPGSQCGARKFDHRPDRELQRTTVCLRDGFKNPAASSITNSKFLDRTDKGP